MSRKLLLPFLITVVFLLFLSSKVFASTPSFANQPKKLNRKIVVFKPEIIDELVKENLIGRFGGTRIKDLRLINGEAVFLSSLDEEILARQPGVLRIDDDVVVEALPRQSVWVKPTKVPKPTVTPPPIPTQTLPWGIDRIDADLAWATSSGSGIKVAVVDTGIDARHPDLVANIKGGKSTVLYTTSYNDDNGHGTHVAGIIAAVNNQIGVVGVGPKISLYSVKVLDRNGSGYLSDIIEGLDWAIANGIQVVNMSLGTTSNVRSFHDAVQRVNSAGIVQVAAAGNDGKAVNYPAAYPEVIAVSATDNNNLIASWSSRGSAVDLAAPGVNIYSTYKGSTYKTLSGTSMACPHVAGAAALVLTVPEKCDFDHSGACSPFEVQQRLEQTAEDLGVLGKDTLYGAGLVNVFNAITQ